MDRVQPASSTWFVARFCDGRTDLNHKIMLLAIPNTGSLVVWERPPDYSERRTDGYQEPRLVYVVGTAHVSRRSAQDVQRVIQVWRSWSWQ